jgi:hypothetical protein
MFAKSSLLVLVASALARAAPQSPPFPALPHVAGHNGTGSYDIPETCATSYRTSTYTVSATIPHIEYQTKYVNSTTTINQVFTKTSSYLSSTVITTSTPTCITTSYPVQVWVTKVIDTVAPVLKTESCTETTTYLSTSCKTIATAMPSVSTCTLYSTSLSTSVKIATSTSCSAPPAHTY